MTIENKDDQRRPSDGAKREEAEKPLLRALILAALVVIPLSFVGYLLIESQSGAGQARVEAAPPFRSPAVAAKAESAPLPREDGAIAEGAVMAAIDDASSGELGESAKVEPTALPSDLEEAVRRESEIAMEELRAKFEEEVGQLQSELAEARNATRESQRSPGGRPHADLATPSEPVVNAQAQPAPPPQVKRSPLPVQEVRQPAPEVLVPQPSSLAVESPAAAEPASGASIPAQVSAPRIVTPGRGVTLPRVLSAPIPEYPSEARQLRRRATIRVRVLVGADGRASEMELVGKEAGAGLDAAALDAVRRTVWQPATSYGLKAAMWITVKVRIPAVLRD